jgi:hypothetical protein
MWYLFGNGTWSWLYLIPLLVMLGFMVMMFVMGRRWCMGWTGAEAYGRRTAGGVRMDNPGRLRPLVERPGAENPGSAGQEGERGTF